MKPTFKFEFEELPLVVEKGIEAGLITGSSQISYNRHGEWNIESIALDGYRKLSVEEMEAHFQRTGRRTGFVHEPVELDAGDPLYLRIYDRLETLWNDKVCEEVRERIAEDKEAAAEVRYERIRDERAMGWT